MAKREDLRLDRLVEHLPAGVLVLDRYGRVLLLNPSAAGVLQLDPARIAGSALRSLEEYRGSIALQEIESLCQRLWEGEAEGTAAVVLRNTEDVLESYLFEGCKAPVVDGTSVALVLIHRTTPSGGSGEIRVEAHTTARLAAALAHEIRNPLSSIKGAAQYLRRNREGDPALTEFLDIILEEVDAMNRVTTDFLEFSDRNQPTASYVNRIDVVLQRTLRLLAPSFAEKGIKVVQELDPNISEVLMEFAQLEQVLRNIIINAIQAMPDGGSLLVATKQDFSRRQPEVAISIQDTGVGIPAEQMKHIFERSFTTKPKGAGLGLAIVREIVDNLGGRLQVESRPGAGTTFTLVLPATQTFAQGGSGAAGEG